MVVYFADCFCCPINSVKALNRTQSTDTDSALNRLLHFLSIHQLSLQGNGAIHFAMAHASKGINEIRHSKMINKQTTFYTCCGMAGQLRKHRELELQATELQKFS